MFSLPLRLIYSPWSPLLLLPGIDWQSIFAIAEELRRLGPQLEEAAAMGLLGSNLGPAFNQFSDLDVFVVLREEDFSEETLERWEQRIRPLLQRRFGRDVDVRFSTLRGVHNAPLCVAYCAKTVIICFQVPALLHNPGPELYGLIQDHETTLQVHLGEEMVRRLRLLARDTEEIARWHGRSTYGQLQPDGPYVSPRALCTEERAT